MTMTSGPATERVVRTSLLTLLIVGFAIAYLWDGYRGYSRKNAQELVQLLGLAGQPLPSIDPAMTSGRARALAAELKPGEPTTVVMERLGKPALRHGSDSYYVGPGGWMKVSVGDGRLVAVTWTDAGRTEADQKWQRRLGWLLAVGGALALAQLLRVASARLTLTDSALQVGRRRSIPMASITALRRDPPGAVGCTDIQYQAAGGPTELRLDPYIYKNIAPIVDEISARRGLSA